MLRPGGTLAVWGYSLNTFVGEPQATAALQRLFSDDLGQYWDPKRKLVENKYVGEYNTHLCRLIQSPNCVLLTGGICVVVIMSERFLYGHG